MVIQYKEEDKFLNSELTLGLSLNEQEVFGSNYERITLKSRLFKRIGDHYENIVPFGFPESFSNWGNVNSCLCFWGNELIGIGETDRMVYVPSRASIIFETGKFKIWFTQ